MSSKPKHKDHRRQEGGKRGRGLSPAELEAQDALQLGRQADTPAQDAPVVATASAGEETPAEAIEPGDRPVFRTADGGLATENATDQISGEAIRQAADAIGSTPAQDAPAGGRQEPVVGDLDAVEIAPAPAVVPAAPAATPASPRRKTLVKVWALLTAALLGLWAGMKWLGRKAKAAGAKAVPAVKATGVKVAPKVVALVPMATAIGAVLVTGAFLLWQGSLAYHLALTWWPESWATGKAAFIVQAGSLAVGGLWAAFVGLVAGTLLVLACWLVVKLWNVAIATAMAFGFKPAETGLVRKHEGPVKALALVGKIWDKIYGVLVKDTSKTAISALNVALWIVLGALALAFLAWCAQAVINFFN